MRVRQVHRASIGAKSHAVGCGEAAQQFAQGATLLQLVNVADGFRRCHVHQHGAGQKAALAVAAAVVEAHAGHGVVHRGKAHKTQRFVAAGIQRKHAALGACDPLTSRAAHHAGQHLGGQPAVVPTGLRLVAVQRLFGYVHPVERLFTRVPDRALAGTVACAKQQFGTEESRSRHGPICGARSWECRPSETCRPGIAP